MRIGTGSFSKRCSEDEGPANCGTTGKITRDCPKLRLDKHGKKKINLEVSFYFQSHDRSVHELTDMKRQTRTFTPIPPVCRT